MKACCKLTIQRFAEPIKKEPLKSSTTYKSSLLATTEDGNKAESSNDVDLVFDGNEL